MVGGSARAKKCSKIVGENPRNLEGKMGLRCTIGILPHGAIQMLAIRRPCGVHLGYIKYIYILIKNSDRHGQKSKLTRRLTATLQT